jgi:hypothetical protein
MPTYQDALDLVADESSQDPQSPTRPRAPLSEKTQAFIKDLKASREFLLGDGKDKEGLSRTLSRRQMEEHKDPDNKSPYDANHHLIKNAYNDARSFSARAKAILADPTLPARERFAALTAFLSDQLLPLRQITALLGEKAPGFADRAFFDSLIPRIPAEMLENDPGYTREGAEELLKMLGFEARACQPDGALDLDIGLNPAGLLTIDAIAAAQAPTPRNYAQALKLTTLSLMLTQMQDARKLAGDPRPIPIPAACRERLSGELPQSIEVVPLSDEARQERLGARSAVSRGIRKPGPWRKRRPKLQGLSGLHPLRASARCRPGDRAARKSPGSGTQPAPSGASHRRSGCLRNGGRPEGGLRRRAARLIA